jgi:hypothetical protein
MENLLYSWEFFLGIRHSRQRWTFLVSFITQIWWNWLGTALRMTSGYWCMNSCPVEAWRTICFEVSKAVVRLLFNPRYMISALLLKLTRQAWCPWCIQHMHTPFLHPLGFCELQRKPTFNDGCFRMDLQICRGFILSLASVQIKVAVHDSVISLVVSWCF